MRLLLTLCLVFAIQSNAPQFSDYPAETYTGPTAPLVLTGTDAAFHSYLIEAAKGKPNFAGRFILVTWGCGAQCVMGAAIDTATGKVYPLPHTACCWGFDTDEHFAPVEARTGSQLIVLRGARDERKNDNGAHYYRFENGRFKHLRSELKRSERH